MPFKWPDLVPVEREDAVSQVWDRNRQRIVRVEWQILDAVLDQCHQSREFVCGVALTLLEYRDNALAEQ